MPTPLRFLPPSFALLGTLAVTSMSLLVGCPGSLGDNALLEPNQVTFVNESAREVVLEIESLAPRTQVDLDVLDGNPDYLFEEAFAHDGKRTVTVAPGGETSIPLSFANASVLSLEAGSVRALVSYRDEASRGSSAVVHFGESAVTTEGPIRFVEMKGTAPLKACAVVKTHTFAEQPLPMATLRIDSLETLSEGLIRLRSGATSATFDGALFPYREGDVVQLVSEPGRRILPAAEADETLLDARVRVTSDLKPTWWLIRGNTLPESLRDDLVLEAQLGPACIERNEGRIAVARPVELVASGRKIPLGEAVTLDTPGGKLTVRTTEALVRTGLAQNAAFGPSFRMAAVRGDVK